MVQPKTTFTTLSLIIMNNQYEQGTYDFGTYPIGKYVQTRQNLRFLHTQSMEIEEFRSLDTYSPVENQNDLELDFKVFFLVDSCCSGIVLDESN